MGPDAKFIYVNHAAVAALGYSKKELLTMTVHDIGPEFPVDIWPAHWAELKEKKSFVIQTIHQRKDGSTFPVEITVNFIQFGSKEINCAIATDITERKQAEELLLQKTHDLGERIKELNCLYGISNLVEKPDISLEADLVTSRIFHIQNTLGIQLFQTKKRALRPQLDTLDFRAACNIR